MEKKAFCVYEAPKTEVVEMDTSVSLLAGSPITGDDYTDDSETPW